MMKKRKIALALGLCTVVGLSAVGLAACGEKPAKPGSKSEYYIVGLSSSDIFGGELDWGKQHKDTVAEIPDAVNFKTTKTSNVYELTVDLYENDEFQIVIAGKGWTGQMGYEVLASDQQADGVIEIPGGGTNSNFKLDKDGRYTFTLTVNGEGANKVTYTRTDDQAKLPRVVLNKSALVLTAGGEETLTATLKDTETPVVWSSDKPEIATVDPATGKVTGISAGKAVITAKSGDATASCTVTVAKSAVNYYLIGLDNWDPKESLDDVSEAYRFEADPNDENSYTVDIELYTSNNFKIFLLGGTWDNAIGFAQLDNESKALVADGGDNNIAIKTSGKYTLTVKDGSGTNKVVKIVRTGDATPVAFSLDVYAKGTYNGWALDKMNTEALDNTHYTCSKTLTLAANDEFMCLTTLTTDQEQIAYINAKFFNLVIDSSLTDKFNLEGSNIKCLEAGSYTITVTLDKASGGFEKVEITAAA